MKQAIVLTTINRETPAIRMWSCQNEWHLIVVGDRKSPLLTTTDQRTFLSLEDQSRLGLRLSAQFPVDHYARKNIGYLYAMQRGAKVIYETDDDNLPLVNWRQPTFNCARQVGSLGTFLNIYRLFSNQAIWPRGFPLDEIHAHDFRLSESRHRVPIGVWQGLVEGEPDVDAIFRLVYGPMTHDFRVGSPVSLVEGVFCPFNSQNTFWHATAFTYLYLPVTVSFRFTDILRGYVAQRLMWADGRRLGFSGPNVRQVRNAHDLMQDFSQETECYLKVKPVVEVLNQTRLGNDGGQNLWRIYEALVAAGLVAHEELIYLRHWLDDLTAIGMMSS